MMPMLRPTILLAVLLFPASAASLKVGIYSGNGAESSTTLALYRAVASMGHQPMALTTADGPHHRRHSRQSTHPRQL